MHPEIGKILLFVGLVLVGIGLLLILGLPLRLGRLPGDLVFRKGNWTFYVPLLTSLVISVVVSLVLWFLFVLKK